LVSRKITSSFTRRHTMEGNGTKGKTPQRGKGLSNSKALVSNPKEISSRRGPLLKRANPKGMPVGNPKNCNEVGHYSKDFPKSKPGNGGSKVIALIANLAQGECNCLIFLKGKVYKREVLCFLDTGASHNFITQESAERMELQLEELKALIEVHFADGVPHPITLQARNVPLLLGSWRGKVDLLVSTLGGMDCILGMEFITHNNVFIEGHNRLVKIPSKNGIVRMKAHEMPTVGGSTIQFMLEKTLEKECMGGYGMLCVMRVLDEFEPKEVTNLVSSPKCLKRVLDEFLDVMLEELPDELPPRKQVDHVIEVISRGTSRQGPILNES
jgi:hypothetical protein